MKAERIKETDTMDFYKITDMDTLHVPLVSGYIQAGFPSPAEDYIDLSIDLNKELVKNQSSTFLVRVKGLSMKDAGIFPNDILVVDKSLEPADKKIAVSYIDGAFTLKRIRKQGNRVWLEPANENFKPIEVTEENEFVVWGIVTYVIKKV